MWVWSFIYLGSAPTSKGIYELVIITNIGRIISVLNGTVTNKHLHQTFDFKGFWDGGGSKMVNNLCANWGVQCGW